MKVLHVLNSRIYSGAEKVACQHMINAYENMKNNGLDLIYS